MSLEHKHYLTSFVQSRKKYVVLHTEYKRYWVIPEIHRVSDYKWILSTMQMPIPYSFNDKVEASNSSKIHQEKQEETVTFVTTNSNTKMSGGEVVAEPKDAAAVSTVEVKEKNTDKSTRLQRINRLLNSCSSSSSSSYQPERNVCLSATPTDSSGICVIADKDLSEGSMVLSCKAEAFVLESPEYRRNHCCYCSRKKHESSPLMFCLHCLDNDGNPMIGYCSDCVHEHKKEHIDNPIECGVLQCLRNTLVESGGSSSDEEEDAQTKLTNQCVNEIFRSSVSLLTIKLISRQLDSYERALPDTDNTASDNDKKLSNMDKFRLLYQHKYPVEGAYSVIEHLLAEALDAVVDKTSIKGHDPKELTRSTLGRVLGCSHAIVDPSLPLGKQTLGRAVYAGHSFYNHSCTPNAYLSSILPSPSSRLSATHSLFSSINNHDVCAPQELTARIHLLRPVDKGEEITLSYIPLSGLSRQERQANLKQSYGFSCACSACSDPHHPLVLPPNTVMADIDLIRQIQFGLNDKLLDLAEKWLKDLRYSIIRREHERICRKNSHRRSSDNADSNNNSGNNNSSNNKLIRQDPAIVLELDRIMRRIEMTQKGIANQNLPESHEVSIESDRLGAAACDLWLKSMGESMCVSIESAFESHFEFYRKTEQIQGLFDPVAIGTQCLAASVSCILRAKEKQKKKDENDGVDEDEGRFSIDEEIQLSGAERKRGLKLLAICLGSDHPWVRKLMKDEPPSMESILTGSQEDRKSASSMLDTKRQRLR